MKNKTIRCDKTSEKWNYIHQTDFRSKRSLFYKVTTKDGRTIRDYNYERACDLFEREGVKLHAYTKNVFPLVLLIAWK